MNNKLLRPIAINIAIIGLGLSLAFFGISKLRSYDDVVVDNYSLNTHQAYARDSLQMKFSLNSINEDFVILNESYKSFKIIDLTDHFKVTLILNSAICWTCFEEQCEIVNDIFPNTDIAYLVPEEYLRTVKSHFYGKGLSEASIFNYNNQVFDGCQVPIFLLSTGVSVYVFVPISTETMANREFLTTFYKLSISSNR